MGKFTFISTGIEGLTVIEPNKFGDNRGYFVETWNLKDFEDAGLSMTFVQDNESKSKKGVLRGLHFQKENPQGKLVRVTSGEVYDVGVDLRKKSATYGKSFGIILSSNTGNMFYIPEGFAHGFLVLSETATFAYKCTRFYNPMDEGGLLWNDPALNIEWPIENIEEVFLSEKDRRNSTFKNLGFSF